MHESYLLLLVWWISCGALGAIVGNAREAVGLGIALGLVWGPLGVVAMLGVDFRPRCRQCGQRIATAAHVCPWCGGRFGCGAVNTGPTKQDEAEEWVESLG